MNRGKTRFGDNMPQLSADETTATGIVFNPYVCGFRMPSTHLKEATRWTLGISSPAFVDVSWRDDGKNVVFFIPYTFNGGTDESPDGRGTRTSETPRVHVVATLTYSD